MAQPVIITQAPKDDDLIVLPDIGGVASTSREGARVPGLELHVLPPLPHIPKVEHLHGGKVDEPCGSSGEGKRRRLNMQ
jgi:hypothetical protein